MREHKQGGEAKGETGPWPWDQDLSWRQTLNPLSHPGTPWVVLRGIRYMPPATFSHVFKVVSWPALVLAIWVSVYIEVSKDVNIDTEFLEQRILQKNEWRGGREKFVQFKVKACWSISVFMLISIHLYVSIAVSHPVCGILYSNPKGQRHWS